MDIPNWLLKKIYKGWILKEGEKHNAWVQLDLKGDKDLNQNFPLDRYHQIYGYDLTKSMNELILNPMSVEENNKLHASLLKGNVQSVTFLMDGEKVKELIEANPKGITINVYEGHMNLYRRSRSRISSITIQKPKSKRRK